ncbi:UDP-glucuronosyltransferase 3A1-like [Polypterus senegalus]|uniref:UDP-glucuronosyltransferase 3A1-like n=1 Tax=Polypterus senegalus TaxID=55291 RepID=UPI001964B8D7|nr:UDP-glucuronosyltransferase 3A1-like [Polypterus senegalus]
MDSDALSFPTPRSSLARINVLIKSHIAKKRGLRISSTNCPDMAQLISVLGLLICQPMLVESSKILTVSLLGGSHYLLMDEISHLHHERGHEVKMLQQLSVPVVKGLNYEGRLQSYQVITWSAPEDYLQEYNRWFSQVQQEHEEGREALDKFMLLMNHFAQQCDWILEDSQFMDSLRKEKFDIAIVDAFNPCTFLIAKWLHLPYVAFFPGNLMNGHPALAHSPLSCAPVYESELSHQMIFWDRLKNVVIFLFSSMIDSKKNSFFRPVIEKHFGSKDFPSLPELYRRAELWAFNADISLSFPHPVTPNVIYVGGILSKLSKPVNGDLDEFISRMGESGFIIVTLGSMISSIKVEKLLREMNAGFAQIPQGVIWRYQLSKWPKDLQITANVKLVDWIPQNDLLGHPKARLLVTHGGQNSLMQAVFHAVPVLGIPLFGDQFDNMVSAEAKGLGVKVDVAQVKSENLASTITKLITDERYKKAAETLRDIHRSQPIPPGQRLVLWVEHILQCGGGGHLQSHYLQLPWYQRNLLDVVLFLTVALLLPLYILVKALTRLAKKFFKKRKSD